MVTTAKNTITISRNRVVLNNLEFDGKQLVDPEGAGVVGPYIRENWVQAAAGVDLAEIESLGLSQTVRFRTRFTCGN